MAKNEIRLSAEDFDGDKIPEVVVEFYKGKKNAVCRVCQ